MTHTAAWMLGLACLLPALTLAQQNANDVDMLKKYAGTWAVDCSKPAGARLAVDTKSLGLSVGGKQLRTAAPLAAFSYYGKMEPPAGFDVALLGEARPTGLSLLAMKDGSGGRIRDHHPLLLPHPDPLRRRRAQARRRASARAGLQAPADRHRPRAGRACR
jgi:hypothetical protein